MLLGVWRAPTCIVFLCCTCGRLQRGESVCSPHKEFAHGDLAWTPAGSGWGKLHTSARVTPASRSSQPAEASQGSLLCAWLPEDRDDAARPGS